MEPVVRISTMTQTHDLLRIWEPAAVTTDGPTPSWVEPALNRIPWVVVRRGYIRDGRIPVGVRGMTRAHRCAAWLTAADVVESRSPEDLWDGVTNRPGSGSPFATVFSREEEVPALSALARIAPFLTSRGFRWGPGGSVGFQLATGAATATASSDLDVILRQSCRLDPDQAYALHTALVEAAAPARIDVLLETPHGGVSLAELSAQPTRVLLRTSEGVWLVADPWVPDVWEARMSTW